MHTTERNEEGHVHRGINDSDVIKIVGKESSSCSGVVGLAGRAWSWIGEAWGGIGSGIGPGWAAMVQ